MLRAAALLSLVAVASVVVAAPVPKPSEKDLIAKVWGKTEGDGEFESKGKELTLRTTFGKPNHEHSWNERVRVPRTERVITGDFEMSVRVLDAVQPNKDAKCDNNQPQTCAGLYVRGDQMSFRYYLNQSYQKFNGGNANMQRYFGLDANYPRGGAGGSIGMAQEGKSTYLKLIRKGKEILMSHSTDGEKWSAPNNPFKNIDMSVPDELTVGVFFSHTTYQFAHATFDGFTIEKLKADEKPKDEKPK